MTTVENPSSSTVEIGEIKTRWNNALADFVDVASPRKILEVITLLKENATVEKLEDYLNSHEENDTFRSERLLIEAGIDLLKAGERI